MTPPLGVPDGSAASNGQLKMTIQFNCPYCDAVIGFDQKYSGKRAQCTSCGQRFIIPFKSFEKAKKVKLSKDEIAVPVPGFYRAVFVDSWKLFKLSASENITGLVFIIVVVCFKFFTANWNFSFFIQGKWLSFDIYVPLGWVLQAAAWGLLFWYYSEMIYATAFDEEKLPKVFLDGFYGLVWKIIRSLYTIFAIVMVVGLPYIITALIFWAVGFEWPAFLYLFLFVGLFLSPMAILNVAVGQDLTLLRPDYLLVPIYRAFVPYIVTVLLLGAAGFVQTFAHSYTGQSPAAAAGQLALNFAAQILMLTAMRSIGLFARHYGCHLNW
jgi:hypothetical protein